LDGSLTLTPTIQLTVTNTLNSELPAAGLLLQSSPTHTASLIHHTANVQATVQRHVAGGWGAWDEGWHVISSPAAAQAIADFTTAGDDNDYDFYGWDEATNTWINYKDAGFSSWNGGGNFVPGLGYLISYEQTQTEKAFTGQLNVEDLTAYGFSYTPAGGKGWHLLGNPFSSALRWNDGNWALSNVAGNAKIWNSVSKSYTDIASNGIIPSAQGFMIQVNSADNSITIPAAARLHRNDVWYKSSGNSILLIAREAGGNGAQESRIRVDEQSTAGYDFYYDSRFLSGYAPQFYSVADGLKLSTNTLPEITANTQIPFGFVKSAGDNFVIELVESFPEKEIYLTDAKLGLEHSLILNPVYAFTSDIMDDPKRFVLHFGSVGISERQFAEPVNVHFSNNQLTIKNSLPDASLRIFDVRGSLVYSHQALNEGVHSFPMNLPPGVYIISLLNSSAAKSVKLVVN
jgi:hypothetical protein